VGQHWYAVRCLFAFDGTYEERITLWSAADPDEAIEKAEAEANDYADTLDATFTGLSQCYWLADPPGAEGTVPTRGTAPVAARHHRFRVEMSDTGRRSMYVARSRSFDSAPGPTQQVRRA
jgi:hypothetical protein